MSVIPWGLIFMAGAFLRRYCERRLVQVCACFLENFEQLEDAGERLPGVGAVGAHSSLDPSVRSPADVEEKPNRLPRRWGGAQATKSTGAPPLGPRGVTLGLTLGFAAEATAGPAARRSPADPADWIGQCSRAASARREGMSSLMQQLRRG